MLPNNQVPGWLFTMIFFVLSFVITYVASRVGEHSKVHRDIAEIAIAFELAGAYASWLRSRYDWDILYDVVGVAFLGTILCFGAVVVTDRWWRRTLERVLMLCGLRSGE